MAREEPKTIALAFVQLLASQVSLRLVNFALNLLIARHLSPETYGVSTCCYLFLFLLELQRLSCLS